MNRAVAVSKRVIAVAVRGVFSVVRYFTDTASATDSISKGVSKPFADSATASDVFSRIVAFVRSFADTATATDAIAKDAGKGLADTYGATDTVSKEAGKGLADTATMSDSGTVLSQDYVDDPFYFADDYVGTKRTF